jgi:hypothetical protein
VDTSHCSFTGSGLLSNFTYISMLKSNNETFSRVLKANLSSHSRAPGGPSFLLDDRSGRRCLSRVAAL